MATHSSNLTWKIPWTDKPNKLQIMGAQRVRHDRATEHTHRKNKLCTQNKEFKIYVEETIPVST